MNWFIAISMIIVSVMSYRIYKYVERMPCDCGSVRYRRFCRMRQKRGNLYEVYIFTQCACKEVRKERTYDREFMPIELWWRRTFHPYQFHDAGVWLKEAGIIGISKFSVLPYRKHKIKRHPVHTFTHPMIGTISRKPTVLRLNFMANDRILPR